MAPELVTRRRIRNAKRNRSRFEIIADILTIAKNAALKTHIMYQANLSFAQLALYLRFLDGKKWDARAGLQRVQSLGYFQDDLRGM